VTFSPPSQTRPGVGGVATISALSFLELSSRRNRIHLPSSGWASTLVGAADAGRGAGARRFPLGFMLGLQESYVVLSNWQRHARMCAWADRHGLPHLLFKQASMSRSSTSSGNFMLNLFSHSSSKTNRCME
jgi:hypothetical protein